MNSLKGWLRSEALLYCLDVLKMPHNSTFFTLVFLHRETVNLSHQEICSLRTRCLYSLVHLGPKYKGRLLFWLKRVWKTDTEFQINFQMSWYMTWVESWQGSKEKFIPRWLSFPIWSTMSVCAMQCWMLSESHQVFDQSRCQFLEKRVEPVIHFLEFCIWIFNHDRLVTQTDYEPHYFC